MELSTIGDLFNAGALVALVVLFATGRVVPSSILEKLIDANEHMTTKLADEVKDGIQDAVKMGVVEGFIEVNGKAKTEK